MSRRTCEGETTNERRSRKDEECETWCERNERSFSSSLDDDAFALDPYAHAAFYKQRRAIDSRRKIDRGCRLGKWYVAMFVRTRSNGVDADADATPQSTEPRVACTSHLGSLFVASLEGCDRDRSESRAVDESITKNDCARRVPTWRVAAALGPLGSELEAAALCELWSDVTTSRDAIKDCASGEALSISLGVGGCADWNATFGIRKGDHLRSFCDVEVRSEPCIRTFFFLPSRPPLVRHAIFLLDNRRRTCVAFREFADEIGIREPDETIANGNEGEERRRATDSQDEPRMRDVAKATFVGCQRSKVGIALTLMRFSNRRISTRRGKKSSMDCK